MPAKVRGEIGTTALKAARENCLFGNLLYNGNRDEPTGVLGEKGPAPVFYEGRTAGLERTWAGCFVRRLRPFWGFCY